MIRNSPIILKKWTLSTSLFKEELTRIPVWVKLHDVPVQATWQPIKPNVIFEPKAHENSPKNGAPNVFISAKDGPNIMRPSSKEQPAKAVDIPSSSYTSVTAKKEGLQVPTSSSNIPIYNPYDLLSQEFDPENYSKSRGDPHVLDDMESEEEVEVVFDETVNLLKSIKMGASTYTALDVSKT
ncbi:zinc knuckle CX2CX4HX4C containing protein [Tanacetum coccineum]